MRFQCPAHMTASVLDLLNTRPANTRYTGSNIEEEIHNQFPVDRRIDFSELNDNYRTHRINHGEPGKEGQIKTERTGISLR